MFELLIIQWNHVIGSKIDQETGVQQQQLVIKHWLKIEKKNHPDLLHTVRLTSE